MFVTALNRRQNHRIITDGLVGRWPLLEDLKDVVGTRDGNEVGSGVTQTSRGLEIVGTATGFTLGDPSWFEGVDCKFSFCCNVIVNGTSNLRILTKSADSGCGVNQRGFWLATKDDTRQLRYRYYGTLSSSYYRQVLYDYVWSYGELLRLCLVHDGSIDSGNGADRAKLYINGTESPGSINASGGSIGDLPNSTASLGVGSLWKNDTTTCGSYSQDFTISDLRIYDDALTSEQAIQITEGLG